MAKRGRPAYSEARNMAVSEIQDIYYKLKGRIENIEAKYGKSFAVEEYYNRGLDKFSVKGVNDFNELNKLRREIEYVESLPSSKVAGVKNYERIIKPILDLEDVSESLPRDIFEIYGRMVDESAIYEMYKYQVLETITDLVVGGYTKKEIAENVRALYEHLTSKRGVDVENGFSFSRKVLPTK